MREDAADERESDVRQPVASAGIVKRVLVATPQAEVDVGSVSSLIDERLGGERREEAVPRGHPAHGIADRDLVVGGPEHVGESHG